MYFQSLSIKILRFNVTVCVERRLLAIRNPDPEIFINEDKVYYPVQADFFYNVHSLLNNLP